LSLKRLLTLPLAAHGLKPLVRKWGGRGFRVGDRWVDTAVAGYLLDPSGRVPALPKLARDRLRLLVPSEGPAAEALLAARLAPVLTKSLEELGMASLFRDVEMPLVSVLARMENAGIAVDVDHFRILHDEMEASLRALEKRIHEAAGLEFNPASPKQVGEVLFETLGLPATKKTSKTKSYSTDSEVLEKLRDKHPVVPLILEHRMLAKLRGTYVEPLPQWVDDVSGRIHAAFHQTVTATGRLSSSDPNLQNIPIRGEWGGRIRAGFVARKGALFAGADYSQIELRILAHLSDDPALLDAFEKGEDIHTRTASEVFNVAPDFVNPDMRREAKAVNFGILYGMGPFGLARELGVSMKDAKSFIEQYFERFPSVKSFLEGVEAQALEEEHVTTILGRRRLFPGLARTPQPRKAALLRQAVNASVQGSAADLIKKAMVAVEPRLPNGASLILQVHDELIVEAEDALADDAAGILKETMEGAMALKVPLSVGTATGRRWSDLK